MPNKPTAWFLARSGSESISHTIGPLVRLKLFGGNSPWKRCSDNCSEIFHNSPGKYLGWVVFSKVSSLNPATLSNSDFETGTFQGNFGHYFRTMNLQKNLCEQLLHVSCMSYLLTEVIFQYSYVWVAGFTYKYINIWIILLSNRIDEKQFLNCLYLY